AAEDVVLAARLLFGIIAGALRDAAIEIDHAAPVVAGGEGHHAHAALAMVVARRLGDPPAGIGGEGGRQPPGPFLAIIEARAAGARGARFAHAGGGGGAPGGGAGAGGILGRDRRFG